jgi:DNA-binding response OmpR family regulator
MIRGEKVNMKGNELILILEKDRLLRWLYKEELEDEGYITILADDNRDVLQKIEEFSPDLFITNYEIPSTESFTAVLQQTSEKRNEPIIINTAYPRDMIDATLLQVAECITKTADLKILKNKIDVLLHSCNA